MSREHAVWLVLFAAGLVLGLAGSRWWYTDRSLRLRVWLWRRSRWPVLDDWEAEAADDYDEYGSGPGEPRELTRSPGNENRDRDTNPPDPDERDEPSPFELRNDEGLRHDSGPGDWREQTAHDLAPEVLAAENEVVPWPETGTGGRVKSERGPGHSILDGLPWNERLLLDVWGFGRRMELEGWQVVAGERLPDVPDWSVRLEVPEWAAA